MTILFYSGGIVIILNSLNIMMILFYSGGIVIINNSLYIITVCIYSGGANFILTVMFYYGLSCLSYIRTARIAQHCQNSTAPLYVSGLGMCKSISVKKAVQILAVGGAKNGGRGLEKKPYPFFATNGCGSYQFFEKPVL